MDPSDFPAGGKATESQNQKRQLQIHGPRPSPLSVHKASHKIKKPPKPPPHHDHEPPHAAAIREPVVIYAVSPKVVHATVSEFMTVVQRLTGISSGVFSDSGSGNVSPAARLAATEKASPRGKELAREDVVEVAEPEEAAGFGGGRTPGILSPSPAMLPTVPPGMFSPVIPAGIFSPAGIMSPFLMGSSSWMGSPGYMPSTSMVSSPTLSSDFFSQIWDF